jgi:hypothetical protein
MPHHAIHHRTIDRARAEPSTLDCTMTPGDIAAVLSDLRFERGHPVTVRLDKDVRDYLVRAVTRQTERSR